MAAFRFGGGPGGGDGGAGLVINPYFHTTCNLLFEHLKIKLTASDFNQVGQNGIPTTPGIFSKLDCSLCGDGWWYLAFERVNESALTIHFSLALFDRAPLNEGCAGLEKGLPSTGRPSRYSFSFPPCNHGRWPPASVLFAYLLDM